MPGFDGTGPWGDGRPGRGLGPCGRSDKLGLRRGAGRGRGGCRGAYRYTMGFGMQNDKANPEPIYSYNRDEMQAHKSELEKQLQWLNEQLAKDSNT